MSDIVLVGLPGSGKSSVGRLLADATGRAFLDLDEEFERVHGITPDHFIEARGEPAFRAAEAALAHAAAERGGTVIATGGGSVIDPVARWRLWHAGPVIWLDAPDDVLAARLAGHHVPRPLARNVEELARRRAEREPFYRAADLTVAGDGTVTHAVDTALAWLRSHGDGVPATRRLLDLTVRRDHPMGPRTARLLFGEHLSPASLADLVERHSTGIPVVVADEVVMELQPGIVHAFPAGRRLLIDAGESNKRLASAEAMLEFAAERHAERGDAWVAIGGGTTGDLVGTAAALYLRGTPLIHVPTTWLAMADSSIGGKVGVDLSAAKNAAGAFWPPVGVVADLATLSTLSADRLRDGMGESLKCGIIGDPWLWDLIRTSGRAALATGPDADLAARYAMVERAALLKVGVVDRDPFEAGERRTLNLGHTIGHALEVESHYTLPHGQAVVLGTRAVTHMAVARGADPGLAAEVDDVVAGLGFAMQRAFDPAVVTRALRGDKKVHAGRLRWILPEAIGRVTQVDDVTEAEVAAALEHISLP